jgi:hypothetical protein
MVSMVLKLQLYYQGKYIEKVEFGGALASITNSSCSIVATFKNTGTHPGLSGKTIVVAMALEPGGASQWEMRQSLTQWDYTYCTLAEFITLITVHHNTLLTNYYWSSQSRQFVFNNRKLCHQFAD